MIYGLVGMMVSIVQNLTRVTIQQTSFKAILQGTIRQVADEIVALLFTKL